MKAMKYIVLPIFLILNSNAWSLNCDEAWLEILRQEGIDRRQENADNPNFHLEEFAYYKTYIRCDDSLYSLDKAREIAQNLMSFQHPVHGGWDKHNQHDGFTPNSSGRFGVGTIDNGQTTGHIWFLAKTLFYLPENSSLKSPLENSIRLALNNFIFQMQYENGGFPHTYPEMHGYEKYIKINQNSMAYVLEILRAISLNDPYFAFLSNDIHQEASERYQKGLDFLIKAQIIQNGVKTGWAQQYNNNYQPVKARAFELPSIASKETAYLIDFLLPEYRQNSEVKTAVDAAVHWLEDSVIEDVEFYTPKENRDDACQRKTGEKVWSRFYHLENNRSFFVGRPTEKNDENVYLAEGNVWGPGGICQTWKKFRQEQKERANGYGWFLNSPQRTIRNYYRFIEN